MDEKLKNKINALAKLFYKTEGCEQSHGFDFSESFHPQEKGMWNKALISYCFWNDDFSLVEYQV